MSAVPKLDQMSVSRESPVSSLASIPPWVIVAGDFQLQGGMDKANFMLARYLAKQRVPVVLVSHNVAPELKAMPGIEVVVVPKRGNSYALSEFLLRSTGRRIAAQVTERWKGTRVVVNGGNCSWSDLNWVHCVHHAWPCLDSGAPLWFRLKNRITKASARRQERRAFQTAHLLLANSNRTRADLVSKLNVDPERVRTVYLGVDESFRPVHSSEQRFARERLQIPITKPVIAFVGAIGWDLNKGYDVLWNAFRELCKFQTWDAHLLFVGGGRSLPSLKSDIEASGLSHRVTIIGATRDVRDVLAASDLLVSPVNYEGFGLNVQEAICAGVPALVTATAGIAELFPAELSGLLLSNPRDHDVLARKLVWWYQNRERIGTLVRPFGQALARHTWDDMAAQIVSVACQNSPVKTLLNR